MKLKVDKTLVASVALHVLVLGWGLVSFSSRSWKRRRRNRCRSISFPPINSPRSPPACKTGKKDKPKPLVEKVAEAKPVDDAVGKITEKPPVVTEAAPPKPPVEKPVEKKPDPPKPVAESKPKEEPKPVEKKPDPPKVDPIAEALKKDEPRSRVPKAEAKAAPPQPPQKPKGAGVRRNQDRGAARQARSEPAGRDRRDAEFATPRSAGAGHRGDIVAIRPGARCSGAGLTRCWKVHGGIERPRS